MNRDTVTMNVAADDRLAIQIREALRDRQAADVARQPLQTSADAHIPGWLQRGEHVSHWPQELTDHTAATLQAGPL